jgi:hypothetical protein
VIAFAIAGLIRGKRDGRHFRVTSKRTKQILRALGVPPHTTCGVRCCAEHRADERTSTTEARKIRAEKKAAVASLKDGWSMTHKQLTATLETAKQKVPRERKKKGVTRERCST